MMKMMKIKNDDIMRKKDIPLALPPSLIGEGHQVSHILTQTTAVGEWGRSRKDFPPLL